MSSIPARSAYDLSLPDWQRLCADWGIPTFRADQLLRGLYHGGAGSFAEISNLPRTLRERLAAGLRNLEGTARLVQCAGSAGQTRKLLLELADGQCIETVLIPTRRDGHEHSAAPSVTVCVSTQAGCAFACAFCASGQRGLVRNLSPGEIVAQVLQAARLLGERPANLVFMGIGEPLANYDAVLQAVRLLNAPEGLGIGARRITLSTCGVVSGIRRLAGEGLQVELSVSLHAPTDAQRSALMPVNRRWPLAELIAACRDYTASTRRIVTFEYTLVSGFNDRPADAAALLRLLQGLNCRVNLIPLSPVAEFEGRTPPVPVQYAFRDALLQGRVNTTLRRSRGVRHAAACGQLRLRSLPDPARPATPHPPGASPLSGPQANPGS